jgi:hypothetical protein
MLVRLRFSSFLWVIFFFLSSAQAYSINDARTTSTLHGLYEIKQEAVNFLIKQNVNRVSLDPSLKIIVPRCVVPLRSNWTTKDKGRRKYTISVICDKTIHKEGETKWTVYVSTVAA